MTQIITPSGSGQTLYTALVGPGGNYASLSAALTALTGDGVTIYVKPGSYSDAGGTFANNNLTIVGPGTEAAVMTLGGNLTLSGNYVKMSGLTIDAGSSNQLIMSGQFAELRENHVKGSNASLFYFTSSNSYNGFYHNIFEATGSSARANFYIRNRIEGNHFIAIHDTNGGVYVDQNASFVGNVMKFQSTNAGGGYMLRIQDFAVASGNALFGGNGSGIATDINSVVTGNTLYQMGGNGITLADRSVASGNTIHLSQPSTNGIYVNCASGNASVTGNTIYDPNSYSTTVGIYVQYGNYVIADSNAIINCGSGVSVGSTTNKAVVTSNSMSGYTTAISDSGTGTIKANNAT